MQDNRPLLTTLIVIGIIVILLLVIPRLQSARTYSYNGYGLTASAVPFTSGQNMPDSTYYTFVRHIPTQQTYTTTYSYPSYTYYPQNQPYDTGVVFPDGCTLTSPTSTTTGLPCS